MSPWSHLFPVILDGLPRAGAAAPTPHPGWCGRNGRVHEGLPFRATAPVVLVAASLLGRLRCARGRSHVVDTFVEARTSTPLSASGGGWRPEVLTGKQTLLPPRALPRPRVAHITAAGHHAGTWRRGRRRQEIVVGAGTRTPVSQRVEVTAPDHRRRIPTSVDVQPDRGPEGGGRASTTCFAFLQTLPECGHAGISSRISVRGAARREPDRHGRIEISILPASGPA